MGARPYDSTLGRFLAVDPVDGGSLNDYEYAAQDPVNLAALSGLTVSCDVNGDCKNISDDRHRVIAQDFQHGVHITVTTVWTPTPTATVLQTSYTLIGSYSTEKTKTYVGLATNRGIMWTGHKTSLWENRYAKACLFGSGGAYAPMKFLERITGKVRGAWWVSVISCGGNMTIEALR